MATRRDELSRRTFLQTSAAGIAAASAGTARAGESRPSPRSRPPARTNKPRRRLAVVTTAYYYLSHAYHICGRFLHGYLRNGTFHHPDWAIAGMHVAQPNHPGDLSAELSRRHKFPLFRTAADALTLGGDKLAVDAVLLI